MTNTKKNTREVLKNIPSIDEFIRKFSDNFSLIPIDFLKLKINNELNKIRSEFKEGLSVSSPKDYINNRLLKLYNKISQKSLKPVINGTGIILHTGLGRAPISKEILIDGIMQNYPYSNLEINIEDGNRGDRYSHISDLIRIGNK